VRVFGQPVRDQHENLALARGELGQCLRRRPQRVRLPREVRDQPVGNVRRQQRLPRGDDADGRQQLLGRPFLEQEPARAGPQRAEHVLVEIERGQDQHPRRRPADRDPPGGLDAVQHRHADVHEHHVG